MGKSVFVLGGTGFVGSHVARCLARHGWDVTIGSRGGTAISQDLKHARHARVDREDPAMLRRSLGDGVDVLVDVIPYEIRHAQQVLALKDLVGSVVSISTASVYADANGRTLDEAISPEEFPHMPVPISEDQVREDPERDSYSGKKVGVENVLLDQRELAATVIRPCAIYGPGAKHCREWFFVKRVLDRRPRVVLAHEGASIFHTTAVGNLAELVRLAADRPGTRVLNCGDPDPPSVQKIASVIAGALGHQWTEVLAPPPISGESVLENPWGVPTPWILDMSEAHRELNYAPVITYEDAILPTLDSILDVVSVRGSEAFSEAIPYLPRAFDYEAEDALAGRLAPQNQGGRGG